jgi:hypothetical protein
MLKIKQVAWSVVCLVLLQGCNPIVVKPDIVKPVTDTVEENSTISIPLGIGISQIGEPIYYAQHPNGYYYYGQLLIEPSLAKIAVSGPASKTLLSHVAELFHEHKENFGLSVTPIVDGMTLPEIILFTYSYDSRTKSWTTTLNQNPKTGMVLLSPSTSLSFKFRYISVDSRDLKSITSLTNIFTGGQWILSASARPMIDRVIGTVNNILSNSISSSVTHTFVPVQDAVKSLTYQINTKSSEVLAKVKFSVLLSSSIVDGHLVDNDNINTIPTADNFMNPLKTIRVDLNSAFTLYDALDKQEALTHFSQIKEPSLFRDKCRSILNTLEGYGLNQFDRLNAFSQILNLTDFSRKPNLYTSGCLTPSEFKRLEVMKIPIPAPPPPVTHHITLNEKKLNILVGYMKSPKANIGHKKELMKLFSSTILVTAKENSLNGLEELSYEEYPISWTPKQLLAKLAQIGVARATGYNFPNQQNASLLFRPLNSLETYRLTLSRMKSGDYVHILNIERWSDERLSRYHKKRLKMPALADVEGYKKDILLTQKEDKVLIGLSQ